MKTLLPLIFLLITVSPVLVAQEDIRVKFVVIALDTDTQSRLTFEDELVARLQEDNFDTVASHTIIEDISSLNDPALRQKFLNEGIAAALVLRPLDIGTTATIETVQEYLTPEAYFSLYEFVEDYRGDNFNTQAVIHLAGFIFDEERSMTFWQGVLWLDDPVEDRATGIEKLIELVRFNLNQSRNSLRKRAGLPPIEQ